MLLRLALLVLRWLAAATRACRPRAALPVALMTLVSISTAVSVAMTLMTCRWSRRARRGSRCRRRRRLRRGRIAAEHLGEKALEESIGLGRRRRHHRMRQRTDHRCFRCRRGARGRFLLFFLHDLDLVARHLGFRLVLVDPQTANVIVR